MKLLTIVIPSFNSEKFLADCLSSLLWGIDDLLDVIVINDGSKDKTSEIAHEFADKYPFIRVVDKENGGHGSGINKGLELAEGLYFKVLDSDDHLDKEGLFHLLDVIKSHVEKNTLPDVYVADYVSVSVENGDTQVSSIKKRFKKIEEIVTFKDVQRFSNTEYFMIHMLFVKTSFLKETKMQLIEKTFYEDNQFVFHVLKYAETYCHLDKPIYLYSIGRVGQSISLASVDKNYMHQIRVSNAILSMFSYDEYKVMDKYKKWQILHELYIIEILVFFYIYIIPTKEKKKVFYEFMKAFKKKEPKIYRRLKHRTLLFFPWMLPPFMRGFFTKLFYKTVGKKKGWTF